MIPVRRVYDHEGCLLHEESQSRELTADEMEALVALVAAVAVSESVSQKKAG